MGTDAGSRGSCQSTSDVFMRGRRLGTTDRMTAAHPRLAIITGADSGMGKATAELLATEGFDVGITYHTDKSGAQDTRRSIEERGQRCFVAQQDLSSPDTGAVIDS